MINSTSWVVNNYNPPLSLPSPSSSASSLDQKRRDYTDSSWRSFLAIDDHSPRPFCPSESQCSLDTSDCGSLSSTSEQALYASNGLPTPALSPPQVQFLSPMLLEALPDLRQTSLPPDNPSRSVLNHAALPSPTQEASSSEDEEMICIKLLAHLKRHSMNSLHTLDPTVILIQKSTAAIKRILKSRTIRNNYASQLLLSNIMIHIVAFCEMMCRRHAEGIARASSPLLTESTSSDPSLDSFESPFRPSPTHAEGLGSIEKTMQEALETSELVGELLKRKPYIGFQTLGRQESLHLALDKRLRACLQNLR